ncbi:Pyruvate kinase [Mitosporidium daphniae]|uniref:Pyruvate kinase n=1 Tax=Mitosporidium daphniae TaxID=1485682 RepID=A0A098VNN7_9MICR|nr:pyruvate kinase [Mitosporidium daphniae]KGG50585.1 pyruvate kinase [Mitosporidium daphniae]|eukprot:XP_013237032.1 pyruvate kinase [Mitosporidium daphniae]
MSTASISLVNDRQIHIKTKIVCTIGPKTQSVEMLGKLIDAGMNVMRLNFSHGSHEYHAQTIANLRTYLSQCENPPTVAIMLDTKGPEIRTSKLQNGKEIKLKKNSSFTFYTDYSILGDETCVSVSYSSLDSSVKAGDLILVDDGLIACEVVETGPGFVKTRILNDGLLGEVKGVNLPKIKVALPALTEKDIQDLHFGIAQGVDFVAASFIRKASDVVEIRKLLGSSNIRIISKIENEEGLENFDEILAASDGIMVARGDLGVEIPVEQVFRAQKMMIKKCNAVGKPCITATQMLESMIVNPRPTRAEATDVANAVLDGSDCVMLSGETAKGAYPIEAVTIMARICREAEADINYAEVYGAIKKNTKIPISVSEAIASSAVKTAWDIQAPLIIALTETGATALAVNKYRPIPPVFGVTADPQVARQMQVLRGIYPLLVLTMHGTDSIVKNAMDHAISSKMVIKGDISVVTSGIIEQVSGSTNVLRVLKI